MPNVFVYNDRSNRMEYYTLGLSDPMPYNIGRSLTVGEFRANSTADTVWTSRRTMEAWNITRSSWGRPIYVGYAFKRIWEGGHDPMSTHYAGDAFDVGQNLDSAARDQLRNTAAETGVWVYVEPAYLTPTWVHFDARQTPAACPNGGYPLLSYGSVGNYVLVLQDALNALGYTGSGLDGYYGPDTRRAVTNFQRAQGLTADGIAGCSTLNRLTELASGIGRTPTVVDP